MKELLHFEGVLKRYIALYGTDYTLDCLMKAIRRIEEEPDFFVWDKDGLPPAGNECGLHVAFIHALVMMLQASMAERQTC